ncbi:MAG TPA: radical SAM protein [bacterium]|nr:radical SAM protein [bacterium]
MAVDVVGIHPYGVDLGVSDRTPPLGLLWIAAALERAGYGVAMYDQQVAEEDVDAFLAATRPRLALIGGTSHGRFVAFDYARHIQEIDPSITVAYGGPHASFTAAETLARIPEIDIVGHGEGEETCLELAAWKKAGGRPEELGTIKGITFRGPSGGLVTTPPRERLADLDALPLPARHLVPMGRYRLVMDLLGTPGTIIMTSRGCPIACAFCSESHFFGRRFFTRSARHVGDEVEEVMTRWGIKGLQIFDSTFSLRRQHVLDFCDELERRGIDIPWACQVRVNTVDEELLARMREAGCYVVAFGVESGDQEVLDLISKGIKLDQAVRVMKWCRELGLATRASFSLGHPGETYEQAKKTNKFARKYARYMTFRGYNPGVRIYPGTRVEGYAREHGLMPSGFDWAAPYENAENEKLFKLKDNVPLLLQPQLGVRELRRLRLRFLLGYMLTPRYILTKAVRAVRVGEVRRLWRGLLRGLGFKVRREEDRVRDVPLGAAGDAAKR